MEEVAGHTVLRYEVGGVQMTGAGDRAARRFDQGVDLGPRPAQRSDGTEGPVVQRVPVEPDEQCGHRRPGVERWHGRHVFHLDGAD